MRLTTDCYTPSHDVIVETDPFKDGGRSQFAAWRYRRERGTWRVYVDVPNLEDGEPFDGSMLGTAICDDFGVLRVVGGLQ